MESDLGGAAGQSLTVDEIRLVQLSVLDKFTRFCDQQGLRYMAAYGTLLGAVRHHGYIPWDDDIDLMMPRADYEQLRTRSAPGLVVGGSKDDLEWPYANVKLADPGTVIERDGSFVPGVGVNIDVFPIDAVPQGAGRSIQKVSIRLLVVLLAIQAVAPRDGRSKAKSVLLRLVSPLASSIPRRRLLGALDRLARAPRHEQSRRGVLVGSYQWDVAAAALDPGELVPFEERQVRAPADTHTVLTSMYGPNYMTPPPAHARHSHHVFTAIWK